MSDKLTTIHVGDCIGYSVYGHKSRAEMIDSYRRIAARDLERARQILAAKDEDFIVEQHIGVYRRKEIVRLQPERRAAQQQKEGK